MKHDREEIFEALEKLGHEPSYYVLTGRPQSLLGLAKCNADLIFNLTESYAGDDTKEMQIAAFLDLLEIPYTGAGPHATILAQDKSIAKKMFAFYGIQSPYFATAYRGTIDHAHDIKFPLIVKPTSEDGSIGIDAAAVVNSVKELMERVHYIQDGVRFARADRGVHRRPRDLRRHPWQLRDRARASAGRTRSLQAAQGHAQNRQPWT